ncbi:MAG: hypothetical protein HWN65_03535 [Candidatus Helarchaeota archaeon]|nr:hypothetical protein [Candidatus Helarchaeota archaeon]
MSFDEKFVTKPQKKIADMAIKAVAKQFKFAESPPTILGLNPWKGFKEMEETEGVEIRYESKEVEEEVKVLKSYANFFVKVVFHLEGTLNELVFIATCRVTPNFNARYYLWSGILDFSTDEQIIFGRIAPNQVPRHGGGTYCFAPLNLTIHPTQEMIDGAIQREYIDQFLTLITQADNHMEILKKIQGSEETIYSMRNMSQLLKAKEQTGFKLINNLNKNKNLIKTMSAVGHSGAAKFRTISVSRSMDYLPFMSLTEIEKYEKHGGIRLFDIPDILEAHKDEMEEAFSKTDTDIFSILNIIPKSQQADQPQTRLAPPGLDDHKIKTEMDISMACIPGKIVTLLQLENYVHSHERSAKAIRTLVDVLENLV